VWVNSVSKTVPREAIASSTNLASLKCSGRRPSSTIDPSAGSFPAAFSGTGISPSGVSNTLPFTCAGRKFIDGEPMNPATNRFAGCS
jgi:hypothetical protein